MNDALHFLTSQEPVFERIVSEHGLPVVPSRPEGFQTLVLLILEQQVSVDSAKAAFLKLRSKVSAVLPENLTELTEEEFRQLGVSRQKAKYIKGLAMAILNEELNLDGFSQKHPDLVREELLRIKGIGHWTIDIYLIFALKATDVFPIGDIAVVHSFKELFNIHTKEEMLRRAERWSPFRSFATFLLWHHYLRKRNRTISYNY